MIVQDATLLAGIGIGVAVAAPVGPMSLLCMRRTLARGPLAGAGTGLGIALGDAVYASLAALGLASVRSIVAAYERPLHAIAGAFLIYLGASALLRRRESSGSASQHTTSAVGAFASAFALTMTNPTTIVSFVAIFTAFSTRTVARTDITIALVAGVFLGSMLWWAGLVTVVASLRRTFDRRTRAVVDAIASVAFVTFGIVEMGRSLR